MDNLAVQCKEKAKQAQKDILSRFLNHRLTAALVERAENGCFVLELKEVRIPAGVHTDDVVEWLYAAGFNVNGGPNLSDMAVFWCTSPTGAE